MAGDAMIDAGSLIAGKLRAAAAEWRAMGNESVLSIFNALAICHMVDAVNEAVRERDAEIARMRNTIAAMRDHYPETAARAPPGADAMARARMLMSGVAAIHPHGNEAPERVARAIQQHGNERAASATRERDAEIDKLNIRIEVADNVAIDLSTEIVRLRAPPGADVLELAQFAVDGWESGSGFTMAERVASALQQYGDERARVARADEKERIAASIEHPWLSNDC